MPDRLALEPRLCRTFNRWGGKRSVGNCFRVISKLGDGWIWYALMAALALFCGDRGRHAALHMLVTGVAAWMLYRLLKRHTRRPRPFRVHAGLIAHAPPLDEYSFPSGHTLHAVSFSIVASAWFPFLAPPLIAFAFMVALSRIVLGLHYPTDVLAGAVLGVALGVGSLWGQSALVATLS